MRYIYQNRYIMKTIFLTVSVFTLTIGLSKAQTYSDMLKGTLVHGTVINGDTVPHVVMREIIILPPRQFKDDKEYLRYTRLVRYVKKVYPYAQKVEQLMLEVEDTLSKITDKREQKRFIREKERELFAEFEDDIRTMTFTQGRILIKLIDRQTGSTSYEIIQDLKGNISAFFWQSIAVMFSSNLKSEYDADDEDKMIEEIVILIENGQL